MICVQAEPCRQVGIAIDQFAECDGHIRGLIDDGAAVYDVDEPPRKLGAVSPGTSQIAMTAVLPRPVGMSSA